MYMHVPTTLGEYRNFLLRYRAEFPIEFPLVSGNFIGNSALYRTCTVAGNSYIVPVPKDVIRSKQWVSMCCSMVFTMLHGCIKL